MIYHFIELPEEVEGLEDNHKEEVKIDKEEVKIDKEEVKIDKEEVKIDKEEVRRSGRKVGGSRFFKCCIRFRR